MTLLSPLALLFGLTALVPLILHLYQRRRRTVMLFSTTRFFTASVVRSQRRLRLRRLLLLLMRMSACVLLALALSRPILSLAGLGGGGDRDVVILLDDSLSMQAGEAPPARQSRFDRARQLAVETLKGLSGGDRAAVVTFTGRALGSSQRQGLRLSRDLLGLASAVEQLRPAFAAGDAHGALARAAELFEGPHSRAGTVLILTDLQETDWRQAPWPPPPHPIPVSLARLDPPATNNVALDQVVLSEGLAVVGQPNLLRVRLVNYRPETARARLVLAVDGTEHVNRPIELPGQSPHIERIPLVFDAPGEHRLTVHVDPADALPADDTRYATILVHPRLPVLLLDGDVDVERGRSSAFYLRSALQAVSAEGDSVEVDVVKPNDLPAAKLDAYRVAVLCNVKDLPLPQLERIETFVESGGGLAIFLGHQADPKFYNDLMGAPSRPLGGLLPAELRSRLGVEASDHPMHILQAEMEHPILQRFSGTLRSALAGVDVYQAHAVVPRQAWVMVSMDRDFPLMVERSYGRGRVILVATAPCPSWTNLPLRRVFIPLASRMVSYLAGGGAADAGQEVGQEAALLRGGWDVDRPIQVERPDGTRLTASVRTVDADPVAYLPAEQVDQPGFYRIELPREARRAGAGAPRTVFAVNPPAGESVPHTLDLEEARKQAGNWRLRTIESSAVPDHEAVDSRALVASLVEGGRSSRGIWDALLATVLALILIEPLIANRLGKSPDGELMTAAGEALDAAGTTRTGRAA